MVKLTVTVSIPPHHPSCFQVMFSVPQIATTLSYLLREGMTTLPGNHHSGAPGDICLPCLFLVF